jgi:hypothetical protein
MNDTIEIRKKQDMYDVTSYSDRELLDILDLSSPSDRELEAKILFLINKYTNIQNESGDQLASFFSEIFNHFFQTSDDENSNASENDNMIEEFNDDDITNVGVTLTNNSTSNQEIQVANNDTILSKINDKSYLTGSEEKMEKVTNYTKDLEHAKGMLNPLLKETVKRIVTIDSKYRQDKRTMPTEFTLNLSEPLRDVVSMKLYSVGIPYTWWTISSSFGSNFFILKGDVPGIDNGNHDYTVDITPGNYKPSELSATINNSMQAIKTLYSDVSFGDTGIEYNPNNSLISLNTEIYKQYNETSYVLNFPGWTTPVTDIPTNAPEYSIQRLKSIPALLGFSDSSYSFFSIDSNMIENNDLMRYVITGSNNKFTIEKIIRIPDSDVETLDLTITITLSLPINTAYTRSQIYTNLKDVISKTDNLNDESGIELLSNHDNTKKYFKLTLKADRFTTNNLPNSKLRVIFPTETISEETPQLIWTNNGSCFYFKENNIILNTLVSEVSPLSQHEDQFRIFTSPYIYLKNTVNGYDVSTNDFKIDISNSDINNINDLVNVSSFIEKINQRISDVSNNAEITDLTRGYIDPDNDGRYHLDVDIFKTIKTGKYAIDLSGSFLHDVFGFDASYDLTDGINKFEKTNFVLQNSYLLSSTKLFTVSAKIQDDGVSRDISYNLHVREDGVQSGGRLFQEINNILKNFQDTDGYPLFSGSKIETVVDVSGRMDATLSINISKQLLETGYSIQFAEDISYNISNTHFILEQGTVDIGRTENVPYLKYNSNTDTIELQTSSIDEANVGILRNNNLLGSVNVIFITDDTLEFTIDTFDLSNNFQIDPSNEYLMYLSIGFGNAIEPDYGRSTIFKSTNPYGYLIPSPPSDVSYTLETLETAIRKEINRFVDLSGTTFEIIKNVNAADYAATVKLTFKINQYYYFDIWNRVLNIDYAMIDNSFPLYESTIESVSDVNREYTDISYSKTISIDRELLGIRGNSTISQNIITLTDETNKIELIPYEDGVFSSGGENTLVIDLPVKENNVDIRYTRDILISAINNAFTNNTTMSESSISIITIDGIEKTQFRITVNKEYRASDYNISFFDVYSFVKCYQGVGSVRSATWDTTLGWILGFRQFTTYKLSNYITTDSFVIQIVADTGISTELFNYFMLCIDDYNQSHLNDGLVTITSRDTEIPLPSYAIRTKFVCDPVTGEKVYNTESRTDYNKLTEKQVQSLVSKANTSDSDNNATTGNVSSKIYGSTPFASDVFGVIPMKLSGRSPGESIVEFGGTLQNQERQYFGPVNIQRLSIKLVSDRGNVVDLNNANWSFSLICEQLYKPQLK